MNPPDHFAKARTEYWRRSLMIPDGRKVTVALLIREDDWRPLEAPWWRKKQVSIIGADVEGNFFLRHSDGSVRLLDHKAQTDTVVAPSVRQFAQQLTDTERAHE